MTYKLQFHTNTRTIIAILSVLGYKVEFCTDRPEVEIDDEYYKWSNGNGHYLERSRGVWSQYGGGQCSDEDIGDIVRTAMAAAPKGSTTTLLVKRLIRIVV
jgi:hypothetical protein